MENYHFFVVNKLTKAMWVLYPRSPQPLWTCGYLWNSDTEWYAQSQNNCCRRQSQLQTGWHSLPEGDHYAIKEVKLLLKQHGGGGGVHSQSAAMLGKALFVLLTFLKHLVDTNKGADENTVIIWDPISFQTVIYFDQTSLHNQGGDWPEAYCLPLRDYDPNLTCRVVIRMRNTLPKNC